MTRCIIALFTAVILTACAPVVRDLPVTAVPPPAVPVHPSVAQPRPPITHAGEDAPARIPEVPIRSNPEKLTPPPSEAELRPMLPMLPFDHEPAATYQVINNTDGTVSLVRIDY